MIKFFRKIRQKLLSENKFSKYLIYAVGEIILVVIGILIALQINNKNQERINRNYELTMLREIKDALDKDIYNMEGGLNALEDLKRSVIKLTTIRNEPTYSHDSLVYHFTKVREGGIAMVINYSPYESIKSTGLDKISNSELRNSITNLYEVKLKAVEFWVNEFIRRQLYKKHDLVSKIFEKEVIPDTSDGIKVNYKVNYELIHDSEDFNEFLVLSGGYIPVANKNINYAIKEMKSQVKKIEFELKK
ncbi:DUF6090 family protein [Winogradskyella sp. SYSU M77433]|uniref:DUF6090 family protein n=1 Tax=Winogradskyella sp. SYSU M77433 TaxID=3042722 RepID=UPI002481821A|nr:DUF6090 family protein [Winogradskyella sp. SYSU M77433]MDH7914000.1 DUF6090 family protein [Winogradskyella sp. SYSU M77433]